jgi:integrase
MPKIAAELSHPAVKALSRKPGVHAVGGVVGLYLQVTASTAKQPGDPAASWIVRRTLKRTGERIKLGLGSYPEVPLATAREEARKLVEQIAVGTNPLEEKKKVRSAEQKAKMAAVTFEEAANACITALEPGWSNAKHAAQWRATLREYAYPVLGSMLVEDIEMQHVLRVVGPIWNTKHETASRVRMRIEKVIAYADAQAKRERQNPARLKHNLDTQLAKASLVKKVEHHAALGIDAMPEFLGALRKQQGMGARAVEFVIYTAARSGEVRGARWDEIDLNAGVWTVPANRMKGNREHRVPLPAVAVQVLKDLPRLAEGQPGHELVFPAPRGGTLSDMTLTAVLKRMKVDVTVHGFRSTFRDWAAERTNFDGAMAELALAHKVSNEVEAAYRRGTQFEKRRKMMDAWVSFCSTPRPAGANVVPIKQATAH